MKTIIKLEEAALTAIGIYLLTQHSLGLSVWVWIILFFSPDLGMLGYLLNNKIGAWSYNLFHHKGVALVIAVSGYFYHQELATAIGLLLFAHSSFDRMLDYGLKYPDSFKHTHLGILPNKKQSA